MDSKLMTEEGTATSPRLAITSFKIQYELLSPFSSALLDTPRGETEAFHSPVQKFPNYTFCFFFPSSSSPSLFG